MNVIYHLDSKYRPCCHIFAVLALTQGREGATKMLSLYTFFYQDSFHKDEKGQKLFGEGGIFFDDPLKLLISCCPNKITLSLSFDANLAKLGPILGKLYCIYYILCVY